MLVKEVLGEEELFLTLTEEEENILTLELINFMLYVSERFKNFEEYLRNQGIKLYINKNINYNAITEVWLKDISKSKIVTDLVEKIEIIIDIYAFIEKNFDFIKKNQIKRKKSIFFINNFRTEEQKEVLEEIIQNKNKISTKLEKELRIMKKDLDSLTKKQAKSLIDKYKNLI